MLQWYSWESAALGYAGIQAAILARFKEMLQHRKRGLRRAESEQLWEQALEL